MQRDMITNKREPQVTEAPCKREEKAVGEELCVTRARLFALEHVLLIFYFLFERRTARSFAKKEICCITLEGCGWRQVFI